MIRSLTTEARSLAHTLRPTLETPRRRREWRRRAAAYRTAVQNYRVNRRRHAQGREDLRPLYFIWTVLRACNFRCTYCDDHQGHKYPDLPSKGVLNTEQGIELLKVMRTRTPAVYFAGGEPTARADLPVLTRAARDLNYFPIVVNTNGSLIHRQLKKPAWRTWLADVDILVVSLDALDADTLREMWVYDTPHDVLRNLLLLRELSTEMRFKLMVNCVIQPGHIGHARQVLDLARELDIWFTPVPVNIGPRVHETLQHDPEYRAFVDLILARKAEGQKITGSLRMNQRLLRSEPFDCRNALKPHVDFDGKLIWPCKAAVDVAPESIDVRDFDDVDSLYAHASERIDPTGFQDRCGAQCNWAQNYSTDAYVHGMLHPRVLLRDVLEFTR